MDSQGGLTHSGQTISLIDQVSLPIKIGIIVIPTLIIFFNDVYTIGSEAVASDYFNYILIIPFLIAYLIYRKRKILSAVLPLKDDNGSGYLNPIVACSGLVASLMIYVYGTYTSYILDYHLIALEIFLGSGILLIFNRETLKIFAIPILLISTALPSAVTFGLSFWYLLSQYSLYPAYLILTSLGVRVSLISSITAPTIQLTTLDGQIFQFAVGVASSGIYSFVGFTVFALFVAYIAKGLVWKRILLFALGYALLVPINILREVILVEAANYWGFSAFNFFHFTSGIVLVSIVTFVLLLIGDRFFGLVFFYSMKPQQSCPQCSSEFAKNHGFCSDCGKFLRSVRNSFNLREAIFVEAILFVAIIFFASLSPAFVNATATPSNVSLNSITDQNALAFLPLIPGWNLSYAGRDLSVQEQLGQDATLGYTYTSLSATNSSQFLEISVSVQISPTFHTPETSIIQHPINYGLQLAKVYEDSPVQILDNPPLIGQFFVFQNIQAGNVTEAILYWNLRALFNFTSYYAYRNLQVWVYVLPQDLAQEGVIANPNNLASIERILLPLAQDTAKYWSPQSTNSVIQSSLRNWALPIAGFTAFPALIVTSVSTYDTVKTKRTNGKLYDKLRSEDDRKVLEALNSLSKNKHKGWGTLEEVTKAYKVLTGAEISLGETSLSLTYLEHLGFVKRKVIDDSGEPIMIWASRI